MTTLGKPISEFPDSADVRVPMYKEAIDQISTMKILPSSLSIISENTSGIFPAEAALSHQSNEAKKYLPASFCNKLPSANKCKRPQDTDNGNYNYHCPPNFHELKNGSNYHQSKPLSKSFHEDDIDDSVQIYRMRKSIGAYATSNMQKKSSSNPGLGYIVSDDILFPEHNFRKDLEHCYTGDYNDVSDKNFDMENHRECFGKNVKNSVMGKTLEHPSDLQYKNSRRIKLTSHDTLDKPDSSLKQSVQNGNENFVGEYIQNDSKQQSVHSNCKNCHENSSNNNKDIWESIEMLNKKVNDLQTMFSHFILQSSKSQALFPSNGTSDGTNTMTTCSNEPDNSVLAQYVSSMDQRIQQQQNFIFQLLLCMQANRSDSNQIDAKSPFSEIDKEKMSEMIGGNFVCKKREEKVSTVTSLSFVGNNKTEPEKVTHNDGYSNKHNNANRQSPEDMIPENVEIRKGRNDSPIFKGNKGEFKQDSTKMSSKCKRVNDSGSCPKCLNASPDVKDKNLSPLPRNGYPANGKEKNKNAPRIKKKTQAPELAKSPSQESTSIKKKILTPGLRRLSPLQETPSINNNDMVKERQNLCAQEDRDLRKKKKSTRVAHRIYNLELQNKKKICDEACNALSGSEDASESSYSSSSEDDSSSSGELYIPDEVSNTAKNSPSCSLSTLDFLSNHLKSKKKMSARRDVNKAKRQS